MPFREISLSREASRMIHKLFLFDNMVAKWGTVLVYLKKMGGQMVRRCRVNFQCRGLLLIWIRVGQGPTALAVGAGGNCLDIFSLIYHFSLLFPSLWETARYR